MDTLPEETMSRKTPKTNTSTKAPPFRGQDASRPAVLQAKEKSTEACTVCGDKLHSIYQCPSFKDFDLDKRTSLIRQQRLCFNCLSPGHHCRACPSRKSCRACNRRHHTLLHRTNEIQDATPEQSRDNAALITSRKKVSKPKVVIIPRTVLATVTAGSRSQKARAQLDSGATITLVTSKLAQALKARPIPCHTEITGVGGGKTSSHQVDLELSSALAPGGDSIQVRAHVVDHITDGYHPQELEGVKRMSFLKGLQLADPEFDHSGKIDILLGIAACNECTYDDVVSAPNRRFKAHKTIFGWAIGGERPAGAAPNFTTTCMKASVKVVEAEATLNSRPLLTVDSLPEDGMPVLTPGHFLTGRPLRSPPVKTDVDRQISTYTRWNLCLKLSSELWKQWSAEYLQSLQALSLIHI